MMAVAHEWWIISLVTTTVIVVILGTENCRNLSEIISEPQEPGSSPSPYPDLDVLESWKLMTWTLARDRLNVPHCRDVRSQGSLLLSISMKSRVWDNFSVSAPVLFGQFNHEIWGAFIFTSKTWNEAENCAALSSHLWPRASHYERVRRQSLVRGMKTSMQDTLNKTIYNLQKWSHTQDEASLKHFPGSLNYFHFDLCFPL